MYLNHKPLTFVIIAALLILPSFMILSALIPARVVSAVPSTSQCVQGGTFVVGMTTQPASLEPMSAGFAADFIDGQILDTLLAYNRSVLLSPDLATSWTINYTGGYYLFHLRQNVTWSDGVPFTAQDIKFSFESVIPVYGIYGAIYFKNTTVTVIDNYTVKIQPSHFWPGAQMGLFAGNDGAPIYPQHILQGKYLLNSSWVQNPIGTGPFILKQWTKGSFIQLVRNPNYFIKGEPCLDGITIQFLSNPASAVAAMQSGSVNYMFRGLPSSSLSTLANTKGLVVQNNTRPPYNAALWINIKAPYVSNVLVRQAISYATNRSDLVAKADNGLGNTQQFMVDPSAVPPPSNLTVYNLDVAKANQLLDQAGYPKQSNGTRFTIPLMTRTSEPDELLWAQLLKNYLGNVGINVNINAVDFPTYLSLQSHFNYTIATIKYNSLPVWMNLLFNSNEIGKGPFTNNFNYNSSAMNSLLNQWLTAPNNAAAVSALQKMEVLVSNDLPEIILFGVVWMNVWSSNFAGGNLPIGNYVFSDPLAGVYEVSLQPTTTSSSTLTTSQPPTTTSQSTSVVPSSTASTASTSTTVVPTTSAPATTSSSTAFQTTSSSSTDYTVPAIIAVVIIIIVIALAAVFMRRRSSSAPK